jgi:hypothetical protein
MMLIGFAGLGYAGYRASRKNVALPRNVFATPHEKAVERRPFLCAL